MNLGLEGRAVFISGASGGIGRAVARILAEEGAQLVLHGHRQVEALSAWLEEQPWRDQASIARADVQDPDAMERVLAEARERHGRLHGCVVNAGIWPPEDRPLVDLDPERIDAVLGVNLAGAFWTARGFLRALRAAGPDPDGAGASLVFTGSTAAKFGERGHADYAASKSGLYGLMRSLKNEIVALDPYGRVNVVEPGWTVTEMTARNLEEPGVVERVVRTMPVQQLARTDDIARSIAWVLSPTAARHLTGEALTVAGGMEGRVLWEESDVDASSVRRRLRADPAS
ncbi:MAG: SDR family oxidoreductase [Planctomycetota bacterium]|jgi:3-oxoacyl-[acyl-carrier protein] reductase